LINSFEHIVRPFDVSVYSERQTGQLQRERNEA
jgi:hypothetical protein